MGIITDTVGNKRITSGHQRVLDRLSGEERQVFADKLASAGFNVNLPAPTPAPVLPAPPSLIPQEVGIPRPVPGSQGIVAKPTPGAAVDLSGENRDRFWRPDQTHPDAGTNWWKGPQRGSVIDGDDVTEIPVDWEKEGLTRPSPNHELVMDRRTHRPVWRAPGGVGGVYELSEKDAEKVEGWIDRPRFERARLQGVNPFPGGTAGMYAAALFAAAPYLSPAGGAGALGLPDPSIFADGVIGPDAFASVEAAQAAGYGPGLTEYVISGTDLARAGIPSPGGAGGTSVLDLMKRYGPTVLGVLGAAGLFGGGEEEGGAPRSPDMPSPPPGAGEPYVPGGLLPRRVARAQPAGLAPAQGYFPTLVTVPQPTEEEIEIQEAQLELMRQGLQHGEDSHAAILQGFGFAQDPDTGEIRQMNEEEYLGTLTESQRGIYELQLLDIERQRRALNRETPVSEGLQMQRDREYEQLREALARQGHALTGDDAATAVATSTAGAQRLGRFNERFALAEEAERDAQLARGSQAILNREGLFGNLRGERAARAANLIGYGSEFFDRAGQAGGLLQPYQYQRGLEANTALANQAAANEAARFRATGQNQFALARAGFEQAAGLFNADAANLADRERANAYNQFRYNTFLNQQNQQFQQQQAREQRRAADRSALWQGVGNLAGNLIFGGGNQQQQGGGGFFGRFF